MSEPSGLESRLRESLLAHAEEAPPASGLAAAARTRAAARRRTRLVAVGVVAAFAIGVPAGVAALSAGGDGPSRTPTTDASVATDVSAGPPQARAGYRWESYHSVQLQVPTTWVDGSLSSWCADAADADGTHPLIERPGMAGAAIACHPASTYGVRMEPRPDYVIGNEAEVTQPHSAPWPDDAWVARKVVGDVQVTVAADDRATAREVIDSARTIDGVDANGCALDAGTTTADPPLDTLSVCVYDAQSELWSSETLTGMEAEAAAQGLDEASTPSDCQVTQEEVPTELRVRTASRAWFVYVGEQCSAIVHGDDATHSYALDDVVRKWLVPTGR